MHFPQTDDLDCDLDCQWTMFRALVSKTQLPFSVANSAAMLRDPLTHGRLVHASRSGRQRYGDIPL